MPVNATRFLRKMRGGAQAHLLATDDESKPPFFVTKFTGNPQHSRILVNEWIAARLLKHLRVATPDTAVVNVSEEFLRHNEDVHFQFGAGRRPVDPGWHLGSRFPATPTRRPFTTFFPTHCWPRWLTSPTSGGRWFSTNG